MQGRQLTNSAPARNTITHPTLSPLTTQQPAASDAPAHRTPGEGTPVASASPQPPQTPSDPLPGHHGDGPPHQPPHNTRPALTDRYYLEWMNYQAQHGAEPTPEQLSTHLAQKGFLGQGKKPLSPSNLRRHLLNWRIYNVWATHRAHHDVPSADDVARHCTTHHITGQYNHPITPTYITQHTPEYERRWHTTTGPRHSHHQQTEINNEITA